MHGAPGSGAAIMRLGPRRLGTRCDPAGPADRGARSVYVHETYPTLKIKVMARYEGFIYIEAGGFRGGNGLATRWDVGSMEERLLAGQQ